MVTADPLEAEAAVLRGERVVLIVPPGGGVGAGLKKVGSGRAAVFIGDPADPAVWAAATAMEKELFN